MEGISRCNLVYGSLTTIPQEKVTRVKPIGAKIEIVPLLGILAILEGEMVIWSAQIAEYVEVRTIPLNWRKEKCHGRLGATLTLLGKMCRRH